MQSKEVKPFLRVGQAAHLLQLSPKVVYRLVAAGELPAYRVGGAIRIPRHGLRAYLDGRRTGPAPAARVLSRRDRQESEQLKRDLGLG